jgi:hypothetical protein
MTINSRNKGAAFERAIAAQLFGLTGVSFKRNLTQYQTVDQSDLAPSDPAWPFEIECKRYADGTGCKPAWRTQAAKAASTTGRIPCVIYKFDQRDITVSVPLAAFAAAMGGEAPADKWAEISLESLAYLAGEIMATNSDKGRGESPRDRSSRRALVATTPRQTGEATSQGAKL